jgi:hypothetical protein
MTTRAFEIHSMRVLVLAGVLLGAAGLAHADAPYSVMAPLIE